MLKPRAIVIVSKRAKIAVKLKYKVAMMMMMNRKLLLCGKGFRLSCRRLAGVLVGGVSRHPVS